MKRGARIHRRISNVYSLESITFNQLKEKDKEGAQRVLDHHWSIARVEAEDRGSLLSGVLDDRVVGELELVHPLLQNGTVVPVLHHHIILRHVPVRRKHRFSTIHCHLHFHRSSRLTHHCLPLPLHQCDAGTRGEEKQACVRANSALGSLSWVHRGECHP